jgi:hypothetical protein
MQLLMIETLFMIILVNQRKFNTFLRRVIQNHEPVLKLKQKKNSLKYYNN